MFEKIPATVKVNTSKDSDYAVYCGSHAYVGVDLLTRQRTAEFMLIKKFVDGLIWAQAPTAKNIIGTTNLVDGEIVDIAQFKVGSFVTRATESRAYICLAHGINKHVGRLKSEKNNYFIRPIYELNGDVLNNVNDIKQVLGFQLLCRDNIDHRELEPLHFKGN